MNAPSRDRSTARPGVRRSTGGRPVRGGVAARGWGRWVVLAVLALVTLLVVVGYFTPLLGVRTVRVEGTSKLTEQEVLSAAGVQLGEPMLRVDSEEIGSRLSALPKVAAAKVELSWPSTVRLVVEERLPVAYRVTETGFQLIDAAGVPFDQAPQAPADLPRLEARSQAPDDPAVRGGMAVLTSLPPQVRSEVLAVVADNQRDLRLQLRGDREVHWGDVRDSARKAAILQPLLTRPGRVYDVSSTALPTVGR
ncbi:cell division protein FtsQ/DivIB [Saccharopolyspora taberi]|uniref:POTRA domain-containing protein n=1 Tax=Saccharopolyspora taberi TaxID=60895 RepID=A0ABN3V7K2_9PSEU